MTQSGRSPKERDIKDCMKRNLRCFIKWLFLIAHIAGVCGGFTSCSLSKRIDKVAKQNIIDKPGLASAHIGICIYDPSKNKWLYNYQSNKYFTPASNTKIMTCYASMKYLGDSLIGLRYMEQDDTIKIIPGGDPTLLHPDFMQQPVLSFLSQFDSTKIIQIDDNNFQDNAWGSGWSWDDYMEDYMVERSLLPIYGNVFLF